MKNILCTLFFLVCFSFSPSITALHNPSSIILPHAFAGNDSEPGAKGEPGDGWVSMPAGGKPAYMGIHGGTMPVSLLVSDDGASLLSFVGRTGNDFLEVLRKAYMPFPSFGNSTREKFLFPTHSGDTSGLFAGNATTSMPVIALSGGILTNPDWASNLLPFGLSAEPLSIEGSISRPQIVPQRKQYRIFLLPDKFSTKN